MVTGRLLAAFVTLVLLGIARSDEQGAMARAAPSPSPAARYQANNSTPSWSPDGKRIAYVRLHDGNPDVYLMNADGSHPRNLTRRAPEDAYPRWSPDGKRIAYTRVDRSGVYDIFLIDPASGKRRRLTLAAQAIGPVWSPDADMIAFEKAKEFWVMRADGTRFRRLRISGHPTGPRLVTGRPPDRLREQPRWQPATFTGFGLFVMDADGLHQRRISYRNGEEGAPAWSPDGRRIAFSSTRDGNSEIYVMTTDGKNQRRLTRNPATDGPPSWSPDGRRIASLRRHQGMADVHVMRADGTHVMRLTHDY